MSAASKQIVTCEKHYANRALTKPEKRNRHVKYLSSWANWVDRDGGETNMPAENSAATRRALLPLISALLGYARPSDSTLQLSVTSQTIFTCVQ